MSLVGLVVLLVVVGFLLYAANAWIPMDRRVKQILNVVVLIVLVLWLLTMFFPEIRSIRVD